MLGTVKRLGTRRCKGLSVVALLVGLAVGLLVAAAAISAVAQHAAQTRLLLAEARLTQSLRITTELVSRHLRRAGHWRDAAATVWPADPPFPARPLPANPHRWTPGESLPLHFSYSSPARGDDAPLPDEAAAPSEHFGLRVRNGVLEMALGGGSWQALTDPGTLRVNALHLTPRTQSLPLDALCARACSRATAHCPPMLTVTDIAMRIDASSTFPPAVHRQSVTHLRVRNDQLTGGCSP